MPLVSGDFKWFHSTNKLGGVKTVTPWQNGVKHDLFDQFTPAETSAGGVFYKAVFFENGNATISMTALSLFISSQTPSADTLVEIGLAPEGKNLAIQAIANETTAPTGVTFSSPATQGAGLNPVDLAPGDYIGVWIKLTVNAASASVAGDGFTLDMYSEYVG